MWNGGRDFKSHSAGARQKASSRKKDIIRASWLGAVRKNEKCNSNKCMKEAHGNIY